MAVIYLRHPVHGEKVASTDVEAAHDKGNGWEEFDPTPEVELKAEVQEAGTVPPASPEVPPVVVTPEAPAPEVPVVQVPEQPVVPVAPEVPAFLAPAPEVPVNPAPASDLPADFPGRDLLIAGGFATWESVVDVTREQLLAIKGIGPATADAILAKLAS